MLRSDAAIAEGGAAAVTGTATGVVWQAVAVAVTGMTAVPVGASAAAGVAEGAQVF